MAKVLFFGDIVGKPGREAVAQVLPSLRSEYSPDLVIANVENMAHGKGVTPKTMAEMASLGIDAFTSGNHVFDKDEASTQSFEQYPNLIRPANYVGQYPGVGFVRLVKNGQHYLIINLNGRVFFEKQFRGEISNPFFYLDELLRQESQKGDIIVVDLHAEPTSEKIAFGFYADGRVAAVFGTHTHTPTADSRVLPKGTAYITDVGMVGPLNSVLGARIEASLHMFLERGKFKMEVEEDGPVMVNAVLVETDGSRAISIQKIYREVSL